MSRNWNQGKASVYIRAAFRDDLRREWHLTPSLPARSGLTPQPFRLSKTPPDPRRFSPSVSDRLKAGLQNPERAKARTTNQEPGTKNQERRTGVSAPPLTSDL